MQCTVRVIPGTTFKCECEYIGSAVKYVRVSIILLPVIFYLERVIYSVHTHKILYKYVAYFCLLYTQETKPTILCLAGFV